MAEDIPATAALFVTGIVLTDMLDAQKIGRRQAHFPPPQAGLPAPRPNRNEFTEM